MSEIQVVYSPTGICHECGNGLWPGQPPCEHRLAAERERAGLTAIRMAMDRELLLDPMARHGGFTQDGARRVLGAYQQAVADHQ